MLPRHQRPEGSLDPSKSQWRELRTKLLREGYQLWSTVQGSEEPHFLPTSFLVAADPGTRDVDLERLVRDSKLPYVLVKIYSYNSS